MSLWQTYVANRENEVLVDGVSSAMYPALFGWLEEVAEKRLYDPITAAVKIKNIFRIESLIPRTRPNNYLDAPAKYRFARFIMNISDDSNLFFTIIDYIVQTYLQSDDYPEKLEAILTDAGHRYTVQTIAETKLVTDRVSKEDTELMKGLLDGATVYASEFQDAFAKAYGTSPDRTAAAGEAFQALESALKHFLGDDKGKNLGALLAWLRTNENKWEYVGASDEQNDAKDQFLHLINFVNKSFRKVKHGQADAKLQVDPKHSEVVLRAVALAIFELEKTIVLI